MDKQPQPKLEVIAAYVRSRFSDWKQSRTLIENQWLAYYRQWRCLPDTQDSTRTSERSRIKIPSSKNAVGNYMDAVLQVLFAMDPFFDLDPMQMGNPRPQMMKDYINFLMVKQQFPREITQFLLEMGIYGTAIGRIRAVTETKHRIEQTQTPKQTYDPVQNAILQSVETKTERIEQDFIHPKFFLESIFNVYVPSMVQDIQSSEGIIVRSLKSPFEMEKMLDAGIIERLPENFPDDSQAPTLDSADLQYRKLRYMGWASKPTPGSHEVLEWWGYIPRSVLEDAGIAADRGREMTLIISGSDVLNPSSIEPPFWYSERPFVKCCFEDVPGEFYGMGIMEVSAGPQKALDATVRARIDNKAIAINQLFAADASKLTPGQDLSVYPGKIFLTEGPPNDVITQFAIQDVTSMSFQDAAEYERYIQESHGISRMVGGMSGKQGQQSATEVSTLVTQAMGKIKTISERVEKDVLCPVLRWYNRILNQFRNDKEVINVEGPDGAQVLLTVLAEDVVEADFIPLGVSAMQKQSKAQKIMAFLAQTANPIDAPTVNRPLLLREAYDSIGLKNGKNIIASPQQAAAQHQLMNGIPGQGQEGVAGVASQPAPESTQPGEMLPSAQGGTPNGF